MIAAIIQMLVVMASLRWTRRNSVSTIDTITIYNRLGSSVFVFGQIIYGGHLINGVSYALTRLYGAAWAKPMLVMEVCMYTLNCLMWHYMLKRAVGGHAVKYRSVAVVCLPIVLGNAAILYRTLITQAQGYAFDEWQGSGTKCQIAAKFCYQTSYNDAYKWGYVLLPMIANSLLYIDVLFKKLLAGQVVEVGDVFGGSPQLLLFEVIYGNRRVCAITSDFDYNYIRVQDYHGAVRLSSGAAEQQVDAPVTHPAACMITLEAVELSGFLYLNRCTLIRRKDVIIAFVCRFLPCVYISINVWPVKGTKMYSSVLVGGREFRDICAREGFFNFAGCPLGGEDTARCVRDRSSIRKSRVRPKR